MSNARKIATEIVSQVFNNKAYSNIVLGIELNNSNLSEIDKALVTEIVYGTIKYKYSIDKIIQSFTGKNFNKLENFVLNILRISIYQIKYLDKVPDFAVVNEAVNLTKKNVSVGASKLVNGVLRNYLRNLDKKYYNDDEIDKLAFSYSFPKWLINHFINHYGMTYGEDILKGLNERPAITLRVNSLKGDYEEVFEKLEKNKYDIMEGYVCPEAIRVVNGRSIESNPLFKEGYVTVQDESAMLVAPSMDLEENMTVLDLCSAPGGKTTHISEIMNNTGKVMAFDIHENKLSLILSNVKRLGIKNISCGTLDATIYENQLENSADRVLIDVPCSGLGIIRKKPEIKYNKTSKELKEIVKIQREIMKNAAKYVKKDGIILYSTCTLNKEENENNIQWFLKEHKNFKLEPLFYGNANNIIYSEEGYATILPNKYMDGFFIAKIRRMW
ncbi:16S rRNA (cytosine(967)-C(5))-methyltransferase RsmB [Clostridium faecium]|uniref:16S rRNA (cytosine(967)-C(5))-methyltransferase n=1 Tax=Clostridium faecium TaxID=2762223 RepID=A0ABR8YPH0_9CLOT|nr:16S rRNA (cytosine(967)-C(5))-methyltransferase RsmB [Clostridium faecium]MBD8046130.1 16S rRNA (cytosine(967)-C(5))-methyltransferase RsmB [Clostridium faecium]